MWIHCAGLGSVHWHTNIGEDDLKKQAISEARAALLPIMANGGEYAQELAENLNSATQAYLDEYLSNIGMSWRIRNGYGIRVLQRGEFTISVP